MQKMSTLVRRNWKIVLTILTFTAFAVLVFAMRREILDTVNNFGKVNLYALLLMPLIQWYYYHSVTKMYQGLFRILDYDVPYRNMLRTSLEMNFINNVFPSGGVSGFSYFGLRMKKEGVGAGKATLVHILRFVLIFLSFQILLLFGLLVLAVGGRASNLLVLIAGSLATLLVVGTLGLSFIIGSQKRINSFFTFITKTVNRVIHFIRPEHPETINIEAAKQLFTELHESYLQIKGNYRQLIAPLLQALMVNISELMTIYIVYIAFGEWVNPGAVIIAYAVANFAGLISVLPGGIGIYETIMTAVLAAAGVSPAVSIPVTVMYRILNMLIQLPIGSYFYHKTINAKKSHAG